MLEHLFGSKTRVKLLQIFLNNPEACFFVRELTRLTNTHLNAVRRELSNLQKLGIIDQIKIKNKGNNKKKMKYYQIVTSYTLYQELKNMMYKSQLLMEKEFSEDLKKAGNVRYLAFTGAFVGERSIQVDFLIVGTIDKTQLKKVMERYEKTFNREINYTILTPEEYNYRRSVADKFLTSILNGKKIVIIDNMVNNGQSKTSY